MNIYQRLTKLGWRRTGGNSRYDCYAKKNWRLVLSKTITGPMFFTRSK